MVKGHPVSFMGERGFELGHLTPNSTLSNYFIMIIQTPDYLLKGDMGMGGYIYSPILEKSYMLSKIDSTSCLSGQVP